MTEVPYGRSLGSGMDAIREPSREPSRNMSRAYAPPEPHEKFALREEEIPAGMDAMWLPTRIAGMPNREIMNYHYAGWQPARAQDVPRISGFGAEFPQSMVDAKLVTVPAAESAVVIDDLMLVFRPKEVSDRAHAERERAATLQTRNQFARLRQAYRHQGGNLGIERRAAPAPRALAAQQDADLVEE